MPLLSTVTPLHISLAGDYGSVLNRTYIIDLFILGSIVGGAIVSITPWMSKKLTAIRNGKMLHLQGMILTLTMLIIVGTIFQFVL
jgi:hypothetical protein